MVLETSCLPRNCYSYEHLWVIHLSDIKVLQCLKSRIPILTGIPTTRPYPLLTSLTVIETLATGLPAHHMQVIGSKQIQQVHDLLLYFIFIFLF